MPQGCCQRPQQAASSACGRRQRRARPSRAAREPSYVQRAGAGEGGDLVRDPLGARLVKGRFLHDTFGHLAGPTPPMPVQASRGVARGEGLLQRVGGSSRGRPPRSSIAC